MPIVAVQPRRLYREVADQLCQLICSGEYTPGTRLSIRAILPWLVPLFLALAVITCVPDVALWLPRQMGLVR